MIVLTAFHHKPGGQPLEAGPRIWAFSDGVYAIAITLLGLGLRVPELAANASPAELVYAVSAMWPHFSTYLISFGVIVAWVVHRRIFQHIVRQNSALTWLNLLHLLLVSFLPFPSALLGRYSDNSFAVILYAGCMAAIYGVLLWIWRYATTHWRLVDHDLSPALIFRQSVHLLNPVAVFLLSMVVAVWNPIIALNCWWLTGVNALLLRRLYGGPAAH